MKLPSLPCAVLLLIQAGRVVSQDLSEVLGVLHKEAQVPISEAGEALSSWDSLPIASSGPYTLPQQDASPLIRTAGIRAKREGFLYGPPIAGGPFFPTGPLGLAKATAEVTNTLAESSPQIGITNLDMADSRANMDQYNNLTTVDDYLLLYKDRLKNTLPDGPVLGTLGNFTQDLFLSMERLTNSPYNIRRLDPAAHSLEFHVGDDLVERIAASSLQGLLEDGRLFYVDYRAQKELEGTPNTFTAACDAYFYIDAVSEQLLPLAIRTNVGANLIYTRLDEEDDWLLAKIMLSTNDFFFGQTAHLASTHGMAQISAMAAIRSFSEQHPVLGLLKRITYQAFAFQPLARVVLFFPGGSFDQIFAVNGRAAERYTADLYNNGEQGLFRSNYFHDNLARRGLLDSPIGPKLRDFPFLEDGEVIYAALRDFVESFVLSYYDDGAIRDDDELQQWVDEARGPAQIREFPDIDTTEDLIGVLTHIAHLVTVSHHTVNTNSILSISATLPLHPTALYKEIPATKGITNPAQWLPPVGKAIDQLDASATFARTLFKDTDRTLVHLFDHDPMLDRMNQETRDAAVRFRDTMLAFSAVVRARQFDERGLSQGAPFLWKGLDPDTIPYSLSI